MHTTTIELQFTFFSIGMKIDGQFVPVKYDPRRYFSWCYQGIYYLGHKTQIFPTNNDLCEFYRLNGALPKGYIGDYDKFINYPQSQRICYSCDLPRTQWTLNVGETEVHLNIERQFTWTRYGVDSLFHCPTFASHRSPILLVLLLSKFPVVL